MASGSEGYKGINKARKAGYATSSKAKKREKPVLQKPNSVTPF